MNNQQTQATPPSTSESTGPEEILIVDDIPDNLRLLSQLLTEKGYRVRAATNGLDALRSVSHAPPDLILLDIMMPDMNGYKVCELLKADAQTRDIPILFLSALDETESKVKAFTVGGVDYITKPFQIREVLARVKTHLDLRKLQKSLKREIEQRDKLIAELDAYAHTVAHNLKNPLTLINGYAEFLALNYDDIPLETLKKSAQNIHRGTRKMDDIINNLLLLARMRTEDVDHEPLDMGAIVTEVQQRLTPQIEQSQAQIIIPSTWPVVLGYAPWVEEVWVNYLSNAIKYGGQPDKNIPPRIELGNTPEPPEKPEETAATIRFWVKDNGVGLSPEAQAKLFTPFERLGQTKRQGHGLGLSIVRRIVEKLGGEVGVESLPDQGNVFYFTLPSAQ